MDAVKKYYWLTKPGIIYGNAINAAAGFFLASALVHSYKLSLLLSAIAGISLVIASACVLNNYIDRDIDRKMARTKSRALAKGVISPGGAFIFAGLLGLSGFVILAKYTNLVTVVIGIIGFLDYVIIYGAAKRRTIYGTVIGSISGAMPPVAGYTAVSGRFDVTALLLFVIMVCWQMPHFYAIAMRRYSDYKTAGIPVWPVKKGMRSTKIQIQLYVAAFIASIALLSILGYTGVVFLVVMLPLSLYWFWLGQKGFSAMDDTAWARKMFLYSLVITLSLAIMLSVGAWLP